MAEETVDKVEPENDGQPESVAQSEKNPRGRKVGAGILVVLTVLLIGIVVPTFWLKNVILNEDQWVALIAPLADSPEIQQAVAEQVSTGLEDLINAEQLAKQYLPDQAQALAPYIATGVNTFVDKEIQNLVSSSAFSTLWETLIRDSHPVVITAVTGTGPNGVITTDAGTVTLNLDVVVEEAKSTLAERGFDFSGNTSAGSGVQDIVLFSFPALAQAQAAFNFLQGSVEFMLLLIPVLGALAVMLAPQKRKAILWLGMGTFIIMLAFVVAVHAAQTPLINLIPDLGSTGKAAASSFYAIITTPLLNAMKAISVVGLVVGIAALIAGIPALDNRVEKGLGTFSHSEKAAPFFQFVEKYRNAAIIGGFVVAGVALLFFFQGSFDVLMGIVIGLVIWLAIVGVLAAIGRLEPSKAPAA